MLSFMARLLLISFNMLLRWLTISRLLFLRITRELRVIKARQRVIFLFILVRTQQEWFPLFVDGVCVNSNQEVFVGTRSLVLATSHPTRHVQAQSEAFRMTNSAMCSTATLRTYTVAAISTGRHVVLHVVLLPLLKGNISNCSDTNRSDIVFGVNNANRIFRSFTWRRFTANPSADCFSNCSLQTRCPSRPSF